MIVALLIIVTLFFFVRVSSTNLRVSCDFSRMALCKFDTSGSDVYKTMILVNTNLSIGASFNTIDEFQMINFYLSIIDTLNPNPRLPSVARVCTPRGCTGSRAGSTSEPHA